ncbi:MAG: universal stress protein [Candidatus Obscuribacterales bacterium]|nr:universal stress protein [Candidatus Obscuribacterales bacterium]
MKILLPLDIVNPVGPIIKQLESLVPLAKNEIHLLYVNEAWPAYENVIASWGTFADDWANKINSKAEGTFNEIKNELKNKCAQISSEIVSGPPAMMIETVARDEQCQMTVVAPGRHPAVEQFLLGSVSNTVVKHGPGTILICRPQTNSANKLERVLIGVDGSQNAKEAMLDAIDLFDLRTVQPKILLFHAVDIADPVKYVSPVEFISRIEQNLLLEGETFLADAKRLLADAGLKNVDVALKEGKPANELIALAKSMPADLIIAGAEGRTAIQHFLLGSVSQRVAMHAPCSVAIVKRQHRPS